MNNVGVPRGTHPSQWKIHENTTLPPTHKKNTQWTDVPYPLPLNYNLSSWNSSQIPNTFHQSSTTNTWKSNHVKPKQNLLCQIIVKSSFANLRSPKIWTCSSNSLFNLPSHVGPWNAIHETDVEPEPQGYPTRNESSANLWILRGYVSFREGKSSNFI